MRKKLSKGIVAAAVLTTWLSTPFVQAETVPSTPATPNTAGAYIYVGADSTQTTFDIGTVSGWQGTNQGAVVNFYSGQDVVLNSIDGGVQNYVNNIAGADTAGAIYNSVNNQADSITINGSANFQANQAYRGGAVYNDGTMVFNNGTVTFDGNKATEVTPSQGDWSGGGAIVNIDGNLKFNGDKVSFTNNDSVSNGGAILFGDTGVHGSSNININTIAEFTGNTATENGGAMANFGGNVKVDGTNGKVLFANNSANNGGGVYVGAGTTADYGNNAEFSGNTATGKGGAISNEGTLIVGNDAKFTGNKAVQGGAISNYDGKVTIKDGAHFDSNTATDAGAISNVSTAGHKADLTIGNNAEFKGNTAGNYAGAILNQNSNLTIGTDSKFTGNSNGKNGGEHSGGAIVIDTNGGNDTPSYVKIGDGAEFTGNTSSKSAGALYVYESNGEVSVELGKTTFKGNTAALNGGAVAVYGATGTSKEGNKGVTIGEGSVFDGNNASNGSGGAIYAADYEGHTTGLTVSGNTEFKNNTAKSEGGAIYNAASNLVLDTTAGDIKFADNTASGIANDILAATGSETNITGINNVSIGSGIETAAGSSLSIGGTASLIIEEGVKGQFAGAVTSESGAYLVNNGETTFSGVNETATGGKDNSSSANIKNNADLTISGNSTSKIANEGNVTVSGTYKGDFTQTNDKAQVVVEDGAKFGTGSTLEAGILKVVEGGKIDGTVNVTEAVLVEVGSAVFDSTGLQVAGDPDNGHVTGQFNLNNTAVRIEQGQALTWDLTLSGSSTISPTEPDKFVKIGDGTSTNTLTLSNGVDTSAGTGFEGYDVTNPATLKLSPNSGSSLTLSSTVKGDGNVLVDQIVAKVTNPDFDSTNPVDPDTNPEKVDKPMGVGTVNIANDNSGFTGNFLQKMGNVIAQAGSKFFGGNNTVEGGTLTIVNGAELGGLSNTVKGGTLNLQKGAILTSEVQATVGGTAEKPTYGTVNIYNDIEATYEQTEHPEFTTIKASDINNDGVLKYINSDGSKQTVTIDKAGLGLFNNTIIVDDSNDFTLYSDKGVRDLTLGDGSGILSDSITLSDNTKLTYKDNANIQQDNAKISVGKGASLNFANETTNVEYRPVISSVDDSALITKTGAGETVIAATLKDYKGSVAVDGGSLNFANTDDISINDITVKNGELNIASNVAAAGDVDVSNAALNTAQDLIVAGDVDVANAAVSVGHDMTVAGDANINGAEFSVARNLDVTGDLTLNNTHTTVNGQTKAATANFNGANSVVNLKGAAFFDNMNLNGATMNAGSNVNVTNTMTLANNPTIGLANGGINTVNVGTMDMSNSGANIAFDVNPRGSLTDSIVADSILNNPASPNKILITGINMTQSPIDRNVGIDISNLLKANDGTDTSDMVKLADGGVIARTAMGGYAITASSSSNMLNASLMAINPQMYRGQVATLASWQNQLVVNNMLFNHMEVLTNQLMNETKTANKYSAILPQFAPYQYSAKDGNLWYKAYGNFERLSMTRGLSVGNNAYGSLIGADFPLIDLKNGWKIVPTAYVGYNGGHQTYDGVSMYQNGAQLGLMGTAYKGDFLTSLLVYGGGYGNDMSVKGSYGSGSDTTGNWFAGVASKTAYNIHLPHDFIFQPTAMVTYNAFGNQNWGSSFGAMSMNAGMLNGINAAPGFNLIWNKKTFSIYATAQMVYNIMGGVDGRAGNVDLGYVRMRHSYFEYGFGVMKRFKDTFNGYLQMTFRNGGRTGVGFQGGIQWKPGKDKK